MNGDILLDETDRLLMIYFGFSVLYLFLFALFAKFKRTIPYPYSSKQSRIMVLIPAFREDRVIEDAVKSVLMQDYPSELLTVMVISDQMEEATNQRLEKLPVHVVHANYTNSSKAKALQLAIQCNNDHSYAMVVILDADNHVGSDFLVQINQAYQSGVQAMQCHRTAKNKDTDIALLDAVSEEMNNTYFRKGHSAVGLSAALSGSGMAFDYTWFCENISQLSSSGEDKELEILLLRQHIFIDYLDHVLVCDEKVQTKNSFSTQRRRWLAAQYGALGKALKDLPSAIVEWNLSYLDKIVQWLMPPRLLMLLFICFWTSISAIFFRTHALKWGALLFLLIVTFALAIPKELDNKKLDRALRKIPLLSLIMIINLFHLKGMNKQFQSTQHGDTPDSKQQP